MNVILRDLFQGRFKAVLIDADEAEKGYREFVESVQNQEIENPSGDNISGVVAGGTDFVSCAKQEILNKKSDITEIPQLRSLKARLVPEDLISVVCEAFECSRETILRKGKNCYVSGITSNL
jgi:hypothetical protein